MEITAVEFAVSAILPAESALDLSLLNALLAKASTTINNLSQNAS